MATLGFNVYKQVEDFNSTPRLHAENLYPESFSLTFISVLWHASTYKHTHREKERDRES